LRALTQLILSFIVGRQLQGGFFFQLLVRQGAQLSRDDGALVHFKRLVRHIALNNGSRLAFQPF